MDLKRKVEILADSAKYDVSCSSSGSSRSSKNYNIGNASTSAICHSFTEDGRCISLLKILLTNNCIYDCHYCINRRSNDIDRATLTVDEICDLTINFYKRNYIEGLFLSSGIIKSPSYTQELIYRVVKKLREDYGFGGYIHVKGIPNVDKTLLHLTGLLVDRMSINIELPSEESYKLISPEKSRSTIVKSMGDLKDLKIQNAYDKKIVKKLDTFLPGGQSTQLIVGATKDSDYNILNLSSNLYDKYNLKRVYYSAYTPVNNVATLPSLLSPPLLREHRLYQADWLLRFYNFKSNELLNEGENFDENIDPKSQWALRNLNIFPIEINKASYDLILRVPGIGVKSALKIVKARKFTNLSYDDLKRMGIVLKRARHFITINGKYFGESSFNPKIIYNFLDEGKAFKQLSFFDIYPSLEIKSKNILYRDKSEDSIIQSIINEQKEKYIINNELKYLANGAL